MTDDEIKAIHKCTALSDDFLTEIGRITAHFALLERDLTDLIHLLLGLPENVARTITSELSFRGLQQLAASLAKERVPAKSEGLKDVLKRVGKAEEKRNYISHSIWGAARTKAGEERKVVRSKFSAKLHKGLHFTREELKVSELRAIATEISVAAFDVEAFRASLRRQEANPSIERTT